MRGIFWLFKFKIDNQKRHGRQKRPERLPEGHEGRCGRLKDCCGRLVGCEGCRGLLEGRKGCNRPQKGHQGCQGPQEGRKGLHGRVRPCDIQRDNH